MQLEGGRISAFSLFFLVVGITTSNAILIDPEKGAGSDAWLVLLAGMTGGLFIALIFTTLAQKFPKRTLVEINDLLYGKVLGKMITLGYLFYFIIIITNILRTFGDFFKGIIMPQTPLIVFLTLLTLICASAVRNGIEVINRCSTILVPVVVIDIFITFVFALKDMEINNFLPLFDITFADFTKESFHVTTRPFGRTVILLMILAFLDTKEIKKGKLAVLTGITFGGFLIVLATIRNIGVNGPLNMITEYPSYKAVRIIEAGDIFTRLEILVAVNFLAMGFIVLSVFYYAITLGFGQLLGLKTYLPLVLPLGILIIVYSLRNFENIFETEAFNTEIEPIIGITFQLLIPLLSLFLAHSKKSNEKQGGN